NRMINRRPFLAFFAQPWIMRSEAAVNLRVTTRGAPTVARVYIAGPDGKPVSIPGAISYTRRGESHSIVERSAAVPLPPGKYVVRVEKGGEFRSVEKEDGVAGSGTGVGEVDIPRFRDMNGQGWYSGDLHIHRSPDEMPYLARAEELNIAPVITRHVGDGRPVRSAFPATHLVRA